MMSPQEAARAVAIIVRSPLAGEGTAGVSRAFWPNKPKKLFWPNEANGVRVSDSERKTNLQLCEMSAGAVSLFRIVIYNDLCNSNVSDPD